MTKAETTKILTTIAVIYQNFDVNELKKDVWYELLIDIEYQFASKALIKTLRESKFPPTPADIIERSKVERLIFKSEGGVLIDHNRNNELLRKS